MKEKNQSLSKETQEVKERLETMRQQIIEIKAEIRQKEEEKSNLLKEIEDSKKYVYSRKVNDDVPYLSIQTTTLYALGNKGWPVYGSSNEILKDLQNKELPIAAIVGRSGSGKSFIANKISDDKLPFGPDTEFDKRNNIIDIHYVQREGTWAGILSSTGYDEPLQASRQSMWVNLPIPSNEESKSDEGALIHLKRLELLYDDLMITEEIKFNNIIKNGSLIILVVNSLKGTDLEYMFKIKELISSVDKEIKPDVLVVHNLHQLIKTEHVGEEIKCSISKIFKTPKDLGNNSWEDQFGFTHLIFAADGSAAGKYYNPETTKYLQDKLFGTMIAKKEFRLVESFMAVCTETLSEILEPTKITLEYDPESKCIKDPQKTQIQPLQLRCHGHYNAFANESFKPAYSKFVKELEDENREFYIDLELFDGEIHRKVVKVLKGWYCLLVWGERKIYEELDEDEVALVQNSDGKFVLNIPLQSMQSQSKASHEFLQDEDLGSGIRRVGVRFFKK